jgi:hypothetical protein
MAFVRGTKSDDCDAEMELVGEGTKGVGGGGDAEGARTEAGKEGKEAGEGGTNGGEILQNFADGSFFPVAVLVVEIRALGRGEF